MGITVGKILYQLSLACTKSKDLSIKVIKVSTFQVLFLLVWNTDSLTEPLLVQIKVPPNFPA